MGFWDNPRSVIVASLKIFLPLFALGLLSTLFLFSGQVDVTTSLPYAKYRVDELLENERIIKPVFSGLSNETTSYTFAANSLEPINNTQTFLAQNVTILVTEETDDTTTQILAIDGKYFQTENKIELIKDVVITTTQNVKVETDLLTGDLDRGVIESPTPITAETDFGHLSAGSMTLTYGTGHQVLLFNSGVKLLYTGEFGEN